LDEHVLGARGACDGAEVEAREREDYVGTEKVQTDEDGRPVMSVVTTRDNGQDTAVYAPVATGGVR